MHRRALKKTRHWPSFRVAGSGGDSGPGSPIRMPDGPLLYGSVSVLLVSVLSLVFFFRFETGFWLVACAAPLAFVPGGALFFFERYLLKLQDRLEQNTGRNQASFLILFAFLIGFIIIFTILFTYPMGLLLGRFADEIIRDHYGRWVINLAIAASLASWFRWQIMTKWHWPSK